MFNPSNFLGSLHLPPTPESWTHRNGRTARVDAEGNVYVLAGPGEKLPEYAESDGEFDVPPLPADAPVPIASHVATLYFNAGKKEKLSKGDILGFLTKQCGLEGAEVGKIVVKDHCAICAVPREKASEIVSNSAKIKGQRVKLSLFA